MATERQIPGGSYVNETGSNEYQIPGFQYVNETVAAVSAAITGTATATINEGDIVAGGKTIIITLTGDTWIAAGAGSFDLQRDEILQGLDSAQSEALGWNNIVRDLEIVTAVARTSDTVVTITLSAAALYDITAQETITVTVPGTSVVLGNAINATPTFTVDQTAAAGQPYQKRLGGIPGMGIVQPGFTHTW